MRGNPMIITGPVIIPPQSMDYFNSSTFQNLRDLYISKKVFSVSLNASFWKRMQDGHFHGSYLNKKDKTVTKTPLLQLQNILSVLEYQNRTLKFTIVIIWFYFEAFYLCRPCKMYIHKIAMFPLEYSVYVCIFYCQK